MPPKKARSLSREGSFAAVVDQLAGGYQTIGQMVYAVLREAILSGAFAPGEWLRQESLAAAIGVSRIPVRTALLQLESEGIVNFHPHRGARVRTLSPAQIDEIYRLRLLLESYALRLSMTKMSPRRLEVLHDLATQLDDLPEGLEFLNLRVQFSRTLYDAENNPRLVEMIEGLRSHVGRFLLGFRFEGHQSRHVDLVQHVAAGDLTVAEAWLFSHLEGVRSGIQELAANADADALSSLDSSGSLARMGGFGSVEDAPGSGAVRFPSSTVLDGRLGPRRGSRTSESMPAPHASGPSRRHRRGPSASSDAQGPVRT